MIRIVLMRHGESTSDLEPRRIEGMADFPLTDAGQLQARALGERIAAEYRLDRLLCSPLQRARQTAEAIRTAAGLPTIEVDERLRERSFGLLGGLTFQEADQQYPMHNWRRPLVHDTFPDGESLLDHYNRVASFWFSLYHGSYEGTIGLVTHGGTINWLYRLALGLPVNSPHAFLNGDTAVHEWLVEPGGAIRILLAGCVRHLQPLRHR